MAAKSELDKKLSHLRRMEFLDHLKRVGWIYLTIAVGFFAIMCKYITVGETSYIDVVVDQYANTPSSVGGAEYLIVKKSDGETVSVEVAGTPKVGDDLVLSVRKRLLFYGPAYRIHTASAEE